MRVRVPGDKSLTQRALILAALADGESRLSGLLHGGDAASTAGALRALGVDLPALPVDGGPLTVRGVGLDGLRPPAAPLDLGNSGTGARLLCGVLAGSRFEATLDGDASLRGRPMRRVTDPLGAMGARFRFEGEPGRLPMTVAGAHPLRGVDWPTPVASAQVKSAILLAGLTGGAFALVTEPRRSRDHTERMLTTVGASVVSHAVAEGWRVELRDPPARIDPLDFEVPGDVSSAAFLWALAAAGGTPGPLTVERVGLNPTRDGVLGVLRRMGARVEVDLGSTPGRGEPFGDVTVAADGLVGTDIGPEEVPGLIDELPMLAVLGARAEGTTSIRGAAELRAKESDRIAALVANLRALGVAAEELDDGLVVRGGAGPLAGRVRAFADHRIAMAFAVLGALPGNAVEVDEPGVADVSFPGFAGLLGRLAGGTAS